MSSENKIEGYGATLRRDLVLILLLGADFIYGVVRFLMMPTIAPIRWDLDGVARGFGPAWMNALAPPVFALVIYLMLLVAPRIDPRRNNYALFPDALSVVRWAVVLFMIGVHILMVEAARESNVPISIAIPAGVGLLVVALGNQMGRLRQNFFVGIRVPWTLASEEVWIRTHRMAGRIWVAAGIGMVCVAFLRPPTAHLVFMGLVTIATIVPIVYAWWMHGKVEKSLRKSD